jgi:hypothetical protein
MSLLAFFDQDFDGLKIETMNFIDGIAAKKSFIQQLS